MFPYRPGCGSVSHVHVTIRKAADGFWEWRVTLKTPGGVIGVIGERTTWEDAFAAARGECQWWIL